MKDEVEKKFKSREVSGNVVTVHMNTNDKGEKQTVFPLGVEINGGRMSVIVEAKTSLKDQIEETQTYFTASDNQTRVTFSVGTLTVTSLQHRYPWQARVSQK